MVPRVDVVGQRMSRLGLRNLDLMGWDYTAPSVFLDHPESEKLRLLISSRNWRAMIFSSIMQVIRGMKNY